MLEPLSITIHVIIERPPTVSHKHATDLLSTPRGRIYYQQDLDHVWRIHEIWLIAPILTFVSVKHKSPWLYTTLCLIGETLGERYPILHLVGLYMYLPVSGKNTSIYKIVQPRGGQAQIRGNISIPSDGRPPLTTTLRKMVTQSVRMGNAHAGWHYTSLHSTRLTEENTSSILGHWK
jgi:hypothetical protein